MKFSRLVLTAVIFTLGIAGFAVRTTPQTTTHIKTVWIILMENHNWSQIIGSKSAPYINSTLLPIASHAEQYFNPPGIHPSEPNYLWLEAGTNFGILDDNEPAVNHQSTTQHLATFLQNKNISWKSYQENIDGTTCLLVSSGLYATKHNPFVFFDDVTNNPNKQGDTWLSQNLPQILNSAAYQNGGAVFVTWDEAATGDGPIGMIVLSPFAKGSGYQNSIHYTHGSTLRSFQEIFGVTPLLNDAANETDLSDLFSVFP